MIEDNQTAVFFEPENIYDLSAKVVSLINDSTRQSQLKVQAREFVVKHFNQEMMVEKTMNLYKELLSNDCYK